MILINILAGVNLSAFGFGYDMQQLKISGTVTDESGNPMPGVSVVLKGTTIGTLTDATGKYSLPSVPQNATLFFSFIGMTTQIIPSAGRMLIDIVLKEEAIGLDEVVVIGYGTIKKATITGSIAAVEGSKIQSAPVINTTNRLTGRLAGLTALQGTSEPGNDEAELIIRGVNTTGDNSPLIVVDGIANRGLGNLDPGDIKSITVLKDASAAIYGSQSANGVILVTTKRGSAGKPKVTLILNQAWSGPTSLPKMADSYTFMSMANELDVYSGMAPTYSAEELQVYKDGPTDPWLYPETNWDKAVYKPFSPERYGNFSVTGGSESISYFVSFGANFQDGIHRNSGRSASQVNFRSNIDGKISDNIKLSFDISGRQSVRNLPAEMFGEADTHSAVNRGRPNQPARWPNGLPGPGVTSDINPVITASKEMGYDKRKTYIMESLLKLEINIPWINGLTFTSNASVDKRFDNNKKWSTPYYLYYWGGYDENNEPQLIKQKAGYPQPQLLHNISDGIGITLNTMLNYSLKLDNHTFDLLAGVEKNTSNSMSVIASRKYFPSSEVDQLFAGADLEKDNSGSSKQSARLNYFGRFNYKYLDKYLAEFVFRYDGSYIFHKDYRFGFFPGFSLGWVTSEENFWKDNISFIDFMKIRGSWGQTGNDRINEYQYLSSYGFSEGWGNTYIYNTNYEVTTLEELRIPYEQITWEIANQFNIGLDLQLMDNKLTFSADYFYNFRNNILEYRNASVPLTTGFSLPRENIGEVVNQGFEFQAGYNKKVGNFSYSISANLSYAKNKIQFWDETPGVPDYMRSTGRPIGAELYYQAIGIFKDSEHVSSYPHLAPARPGDIIFKDVNEDGLIDGLDRMRDDLSKIPLYSGGISLDVTYKNFYVSTLIQGTAGSRFDIDLHCGGPSTNWFDFISIDRWSADNPNGTNPRAAAYDGGGVAYWRDNANTFWSYKGDYIRLKSAEIGYNVPKIVTDKIGAGGLRVYISGQNLFTLSGLPKGFDPDRKNILALPINRNINIGAVLDF